MKGFLCYVTCQCSFGVCKVISGQIKMPTGTGNELSCPRGRKTSNEESLVWDKSNWKGTFLQNPLLPKSFFEDTLVLKWLKWKIHLYNTYLAWIITKQTGSWFQKQKACITWLILRTCTASTINILVGNLITTS